MRTYEDELNNKGINIIAGIDEAGRGPGAGPVVAAAVVLNNEYNNLLINDSKKLTEKQRLLAYKEIKKNAISVGIGIVSSEEIDEINILNATKLAMKRAVENLEIKVEHLLIDALNINLEIEQTNIIKGDQKSISIAAASIIAKVTRDNLMIEYSNLYPNYLFNKHKGYLTKEHISLIYKYGPSPIHRKSFKPISDFFKK